MSRLPDDPQSRASNLAEAGSPPGDRHNTRATKGARRPWRILNQSRFREVVELARIHDEHLSQHVRISVRGRPYPEICQISIVRHFVRRVSPSADDDGVHIRMRPVRPANDVSWE